MIFLKTFCPSFKISLHKKYKFDPKYFCFYVSWILLSTYYTRHTQEKHYKYLRDRHKEKNKHLLLFTIEHSTQINDMKHTRPVKRDKLTHSYRLTQSYTLNKQNNKKKSLLFFSNYVFFFLFFFLFIFYVTFPVRKDLTLRLQFRFFNLHRKTGTMIQ